MGYHRPVAFWNPGKQSEHLERKFFRENALHLEDHAPLGPLSAHSCGLVVEAPFRRDRDEDGFGILDGDEWLGQTGSAGALR